MISFRTKDCLSIEMQNVSVATSLGYLSLRVREASASSGLSVLWSFSSMGLLSLTGDLSASSALLIRSASDSVTLTTALSKASLNFLALSELANRIASVSAFASSSAI